MAEARPLVLARSRLISKRMLALAVLTLLLTAPGALHSPLVALAAVGLLVLELAVPALMRAGYRRRARLWLGDGELRLRNAVFTRSFPLGEVGGIAFRTLITVSRRSQQVAVVYARDGHALAVLLLSEWNGEQLRQVAGALGERMTGSRTLCIQELERQFPGVWRNRRWSKLVLPLVAGAGVSAIWLLGVH